MGRPGACWNAPRPQSLRYMRGILLAAVNLSTTIDPDSLPAGAGSFGMRNPTFRNIGAGERFLFLRDPIAPTEAVYLIHNGVLFPDEVTVYMEAHDALRSAPAVDSDMPRVVPAYDFFLAAQGAPVRIASPQPYLSIQPGSKFDMGYIRGVFSDIFRHGPRMAPHLSGTTRSYR